MEIDHLVVAGSSLAKAVEVSEQALGVTLTASGRHELFGTHNRLLGFHGRDYFEAIAIDPDGNDPGRPRWFGLDRFEGPARLVTWVARVPDLKSALAIYPEAGQIIDLARGDLRWRMAVPADGALAYGGVMPMLIEWQGDLHPCDQLGQSGLLIARLELRHPEAKKIGALFDALGLNDPRVQLQDAPEASLQAVLSGPDGERLL
jgi:hypothetical protein